MKRMGLMSYSIIMFLILISLFLFSQTVAVLSYQFAESSKYGMSFIAELLMVLVLLPFLLFTKNKFALLYKKENFFKSLLMSLPVLIFSTVYLFIGFVFVIFVQKDLNIYNLVTVVGYTICIGFFEEFLCRGFVLTSYLRKYGDTKDGVLKSIFLSSLFFGLVHLVNILAGQSVFLTCMQVIQTTALGFLLGTIYFRTRNIWACVFIHSYYDFCILFNSINYIKDPISEPGVLLGIMSTLLYGSAWLLCSRKLLRKSAFKEQYLINDELTYEDIKKEKKNNRICNVCIITLLVMAPFISMLFSSTSKVTEFEYKELELDNYVSHYIHKDKFVVNNLVVNLSFDVDEMSRLIVTNIDTNEEVIIAKNVTLFTVIDSDDYYEVMYFNNMNLYYGRLYKDGMNNSKEYLNSIKDNLKKFNVPVVSNVGYVTIDGDNNMYPYFISDVNDEFIIKNNLLHLIQ